MLNHDATLSVFTEGKLKNCLTTVGIKPTTYYKCFASPILYQLSYEVKSVRVGDISEFNLVPSTSVYILNQSGFQMAFCLCLGFSIKKINSPIFKFSSIPPPKKTFLREAYKVSANELMIHVLICI